jgi:hypothetical protein
LEDVPVVVLARAASLALAALLVVVDALFLNLVAVALLVAVDVRLVALVLPLDPDLLLVRRKDAVHLAKTVVTDALNLNPDPDLALPPSLLLPLALALVLAVKKGKIT